MKTIIVTVKWLGIGTAAASQFAHMLPNEYGVWGLIAVGLASSLKDTLYKVGDQLDDGKQNKSI